MFKLQVTKVFRVCEPYNISLALNSGKYNTVCYESKTTLVAKFG
jgi:hypothetical protein